MWTTRACGLLHVQSLNALKFLFKGIVFTALVDGLGLANKGDANNNQKQHNNFTNFMLLALFKKSAMMIWWS